MDCGIEVMPECLFILFLDHVLLAHLKTLLRLLAIGFTDLTGDGPKCGNSFGFWSFLQLSFHIQISTNLSKDVILST